MLKFICTTSNSYLHLIPVFTYLFNKYWSSEQEATILGYQEPKCLLPANFTFHSMGAQGDVTEWSTDLRKYFESMEDEWLCWMMEDSFIRSYDPEQFALACSLMYPGIGRIDLTKDVSKRPHRSEFGIIWAGPRTQYRLSTQPSIWCKEFLLTYLTPGLSPWQMEVQDAFDDKWAVVGLEKPAIIHNEGVRKWDPHELDLNKFSPEDVAHIKSLL
jgi:hypothetical protein